MNISQDFSLTASVWDGDKFLIEAATANGSRQMKVTAEVVRAYLNGTAGPSSATDRRVLPFRGFMDSGEISPASASPALPLEVWFVRSAARFAVAERSSEPVSSSAPLQRRSLPRRGQPLRLPGRRPPLLVDGRRAQTHRHRHHRPGHSRRHTPRRDRRHHGGSLPSIFLLARQVARLAITCSRGGSPSRGSRGGSIPRGGSNPRGSTRSSSRACSRDDGGKGRERTQGSRAHRHDPPLRIPCRYDPPLRHYHRQVETVGHHHRQVEAIRRRDHRHAIGPHHHSRITNHSTHTPWHHSSIQQA